MFMHRTSVFLLLMDPVGRCYNVQYTIGLCVQCVLTRAPRGSRAPRGFLPVASGCQHAVNEYCWGFLSCPKLCSNWPAQCPLPDLSSACSTEWLGMIHDGLWWLMPSYHRSYTTYTYIHYMRMPASPWWSVHPLRIHGKHLSPTHRDHQGSSTVRVSAGCLWETAPRVVPSQSSLTMAWAAARFQRGRRWWRERRDHHPWLPRPARAASLLFDSSGDLDLLDRIWTAEKNNAK